MKKKFTLLMAVLISALGFSQMFINTYCSGGPPALTLSNGYGPMYSTTTANATSRTAVIYPASQLSALSGQILSGITFHKGSTTGAMLGTPNFKVYVKRNNSS